jgi:biotin carboxyl carrier protein
MKVNVKVADVVYEVEIEDLNQRPVIARVDGEVFEVMPESISAPIHDHSTPAPSASPKLATGLQTSRAANGHDILAPLPGTITEIKISAGMHVNAGDPLLIIEAMKMKNIIRAGGAGTIKTVLVSAGQTVKHHQALVEFE